MKSNDSPEIQDRRETSDIPGFPSGDNSKNNDGKEIKYYGNAMMDTA